MIFTVKLIVTSELNISFFPVAAHTTFFILEGFFSKNDHFDRYATSPLAILSPSKP